MRSFFRLASPSCWVAAIIFFFLPWVDLGCDRNRAAHRRVTMSGAQIAWGGQTIWRDDQVTKREFGGFLLWRTIHGSVACLLLTVYFIGLVFSVTYALVRAPSRTRGEHGFLVTLFLLVWLTGGSALLCGGNPFIAPSSDQLLGWYYASYLVNAAAVGLCSLEWYLLKPMPSQDSSTAVHDGSWDEGVPPTS